MAKLYFKYGAMGSSKTAQALITKFNYEEKHMKVLLLKPSIDTRDGDNICKSRVGLYALANIFAPNDNILEILENYRDVSAIIVDECQFLTKKQVDELGMITIDYDIPVLCFGLRTDFTSHLFEGSQRLFEIAESISEIKSVCKCGEKATINARIDDNGKILTEGEQILIGDDIYEPMCRKCWMKQLKKQKENIYE